MGRKGWVNSVSVFVGGSFVLNEFGTSAPSAGVCYVFIRSVVGGLCVRGRRVCGYVHVFLLYMSGEDE